MKGSRYKKCVVCQKSIRKFLDVVTLMKASNITKGEFRHKYKYMCNRKRKKNK